MKNKWIFCLGLSLLFASSGYAITRPEYPKSALANGAAPAKEEPAKKPSEAPKPEGWSFDIGGQYTWMSFTSPPTFTGSTGGAHARITYQRPNMYFGQVRTIYNNGNLTSSTNSASESESYTEAVAGYCFRLSKMTSCYLWTLTPYAGLGLEFLTEHRTSYTTDEGLFVPSIKLRYQLYYAVGGLDVHCSVKRWSFGVQGDIIPSFQEYLTVGGLSEAAWKLKHRVGFDVRTPVAFRMVKNIWIEGTPYYRLLPIGNSSVLSLPARNLHQWGAFITFRFFI
jgi:hypothetical protein